MSENLNAHEFYIPPTLRQRIAGWNRWPWAEQVPAKLHDWSAPWVTVVRRNGRIIAWHHDQSHPYGVGVWVTRWSCFFGLITGYLNFDFEHMPGAPGIDMTLPEESK